MAPRLLRAAAAVIGLLLAGACARGPTVGPPSTRPADPSALDALARTSGEAGTIVETALRLVGTPYRDGGADPAGFDCSGFVQYVFAGRGIALPRGVGGQARAGIKIPRQAIAAGDLVFFRTAGAAPSHVGIALDADSFVHAPSSNGQVRIDRLSAPYWTRRFVGARRVASPGR